jgi:hypothetical protein
VSTPQFPGLGPGPNGSSGFPGSRGTSFPGLPGGTVQDNGHRSPTTGGGQDFPRGGSEPSGGAGSSGPPIGLFVGAVATALAGLSLVVLDGWGWHVVGWAVATFGTAALLIVATLKDTHLRASVWYLSRDALVRGLRVAALALALVAAATHAWFFADWFSRLAVFSS